MKHYYRGLFRFAIVSAIFLLAHSARAQENAGESGETLPRPVSAPSDSGMYKGINQLPESIRRSAPFARALNEMTKRAGTSGTFDEEARLRAFEQSQQDLMRSATTMSEKSSGGGGEHPLDNAAWTNIGLNTAYKKISATDSIPVVFGGGCTTALAIDPTNTNIIYAGATSGGVWKSTNQGAHWASLTDNAIPNQSVASIAIDPKNHNTLYVGTGNGYASVDELTGTGLYKSKDGGGTWTRIGASSLTGTIVKVFVDPVHSNIILASSYTSNKGVYRSTDSGATWTKVYTAEQPVWDITGSTSLLYFVEGNNAGTSPTTECGVYKSINEGASWGKTGSASLPRGDSIGRCALAASKAHPERVFVLMANPDGNEINAYRSLFQSTDNGANWSDFPIPSTLFQPTTAQGPQGWYDCTLGVSPNSASGADTIVIGGIEAYINYSDGGGWNDYNDGSTSWTYGHVDHHSFAFDPNDPTIMYDGDDGGVYWSQDAGFSWSYRSNQMVTGRIYHMSLDRNSTENKTALVGMQDQGTWTLTYPGGATSILFGGDGLQPIYNSQYSMYPFYAEIPLGQIYRNFESNPNFWDEVDTGAENTSWDTPFKMAITSVNGAAGYHVFYQGREHLWLSTNDGTNWAIISPTFNDYIHSIGLSQVDANTIYVGTTGQISVTTNGGTSWTSKTSGMASAMVTSIVTTGRNPNFALASFYTQNGHRAMCSTDKGSTWSDVSGTSGAALPLVGVNCVALDSIAPERIWYAATDNGIYYTIDSGRHWAIAGSGLGLVACSDVEVQADKQTIRVATFGRGIWQGNTGTLPVELAGFSYQKEQSSTLTGTELSWHTDSEHGSAFFIVERSIDGAAFQDLSPTIASKAPGGESSTQLSYAFFDSTHSAGDYIYQLKQVDLDGSLHYSNSVELHWGASGLIVSQNYPNPFVIGTPSANSGTNFNPFGQNQAPIVSPWPETRFHYELPDADVVTLKIYNSIGKVVRTLLDQVQQQPGDPDAFWDGKADDGSYCTSGTYFYVIQTGHYGSVVNKMILISN
ncbi:MAG TPA: FlgD immunoglobulin-like domain containing protein [Candidatus Kapabacteria bacterium]|nr:FlgD immunoglobulin-like domain containing protein [Candidatus Kapabacteria bacterium]